MSASTFFDRARGRTEQHVEQHLGQHLGQHAEQHVEQRAQKRGPARDPRRDRPSDSDPDDDSRRDGWIGVDFARLTTAPRSRTWLPLLVLALAFALGIASLRIDLIRTRYALMDAMKQEQALIEEQRALIVTKLSLRDPSALAALAEARGYRPAEVVRTLADPMPIQMNAAQGLPAVAAGPPSTHTPPPASKP